MEKTCKEQEPMCETSESGERLISRDELLPISLDIGRRILEVFGYQRIPAIVFRLKSTKKEIDLIVNGEAMPTSELLLGIRKATGASIDWILTGEGPRFAVKPSFEQSTSQSMSLAVIEVHRDRDSSSNSSMYSRKTLREIYVERS